PQHLPLVAPDSPEAFARVRRVIEAARTLPGARPDRIALFGHSRGAGAAIFYAMQAKGVGAVILNSAGYPPDDAARRVAQIQSPVLILHGEADGAADSGSANTAVRMAQDFEAALRRAGKPVEAKYYRGASHNSIFTDPAQRGDEVSQALSFLRQYIFK